MLACTGFASSWQRHFSRSSSHWSHQVAVCLSLSGYLAPCAFVHQLSKTETVKFTMTQQEQQMNSSGPIQYILLLSLTSLFSDVNQETMLEV